MMNSAIPSIHDYLASLGVPREAANPLTFEEAMRYAEANQSMKEHYQNWMEASSHDHEVETPLRLYTIDLTPDLFGRLIIQQVGGGHVQADLMGNGQNNMLVETICRRLISRGLGLEIFLPGGSHHTGWTEKVAEYHDMLADNQPPPHLLLTMPNEAERLAQPRSVFFISDGNHRALAAGMHYYVSSRAFPDMKAIIAWGDRMALQNRFGIKI